MPNTVILEHACSCKATNALIYDLNTSCIKVVYKALSSFW